MALPPGTQGLVVLTEGTGHWRHSLPGRQLARLLQEAGLGTLQVNLLTVKEEAARQDRQLRFNVGLMARRLLGVTRWAQRQQPGTSLRVGYCATGPGARAAVLAAAARPGWVEALVSRGGRVDVGRALLAQVRAPTLLLVGDGDASRVALTRRAHAALQTEKALEVLPGAGHRCEEPEVRSQVEEWVRQWFTTHLLPAAELLRTAP